jgi:hypothetical protein
MEPHKEAKYSKSLDPEETEKVLMDDESDVELEDRRTGGASCTVLLILRR